MKKVRVVNYKELLKKYKAQIKSNKPPTTTVKKKCYMKKCKYIPVPAKDVC